MQMSELIDKLESLSVRCSNMVESDNPECIWRADAEVLNEVIEKLRNEYKGKNAAEIISNIMEKENVNKTVLAKRIGCVRQNISQMLTRGTVNMRYDSFYKLLEALEYEIIVRKK